MRQISNYNNVLEFLALILGGVTIFLCLFPKKAMSAERMRVPLLFPSSRCDSAGETNRETLLGAKFENVADGCLMEGGWAFKLGGEGLHRGTGCVLCTNCLHI